MEGRERGCRVSVWTGSLEIKLRVNARHKANLAPQNRLDTSRGRQNWLNAKNSAAPETIDVHE